MILIGAVLGVYYGAKAREMTMGSYLNVFFIESFDMFIFVFLVASYAAEAATATLLHPKDEFMISPTSRYITHNALSIMGFICAVASAKILSSFVQSIPYFVAKKSEDGKTTIRKSAPQLPLLLLAAAAITTYYAIWIPFANTIVIAKGLGQVREFDYAFNLLVHPFTNKAVIARQYGFDPTKHIVEVMGFNLTASYYLMVAHIGGSVLKGLFAALDVFIVGTKNHVDMFEAKLKKDAIKQGLDAKISAKGNNSGNPPVNNPSPPATNPPAPINKSSIVESLLILSEFKGDEGKAVEFEKTILSKAQEMGAQFNSILTEFNGYKVKIIQINKSSSSATEKTTQLSTLEFQIRNLIQASKDDKGLELTIP
jgi:hypothetical protein